MTSNRDAKRHVNAPDVYAYGYWPNRIRRWRRALALPLSLGDSAFQRPVAGRLLPTSKIQRRARRRTR